MEIKKLIYFLSFICLCVVSNSYAETTVVDLNINKTRGIHTAGKGGKCTSGSDKLSVSYKSCRKTPNCSSSSLLCGQDSILSMFSGKSADNDTCSLDGKDLYYAEAGMGRVINYAEEDRQLKRNPKIPFADTFKIDTINKGIVLSLGGGYVWKFDSTLVPYASLGLEYSYMPETRLHGQIFAKAEAPIYAYEYKISHSNLRLLGKANFHQWKGFMPYLSVGLGGSRNQITNYREHQLTDDPRTTPTRFKDSKELEFSYSIGAGLDYQCTKNFLLSLGYRYDDFGSVKTGDSVGLYSGNHFSHRFSSNSIGLSGRYVFE